MNAFNIWSALALGEIIATMILQLINIFKFNNQPGNSTRYTLLLKEVSFAGHALMVWEVTALVRDHYPTWFGEVFGFMFFMGTTCWLLVWIRGSNLIPDRK